MLDNAPTSQQSRPDSVLSGVGEGLTNLVAAPFRAAREILAPPRTEVERFASRMPTGGMGAIAAKRLLLDPQTRMFERAAVESRGGETAASLGYRAAGALPIIGPMAADYVEGLSSEPRRTLGRMAVELPAALLGPRAVRAGAPAARAGVARVGAAGRGAAESLAESGLGISHAGKTFGKTPGRAILEETTGGPRGIAGSARERLAAIDDATRSEFQAAGASGRTASINPAIRVIDDEIAAAARAQNPGLVSALTRQRERLTVDTASGNPLPTSLDPMRVWEIKRNWGDDVNWNQIAPKLRTRIDREVYRAIDSELDRVAPRTAGLNQRASSLITVRRRADVTSRSERLPARVMGRVGARTGALVGATGGYFAGGPLGAAAGLVLPEVLAAPGTRIAAARGLYRLSGGRRAPAPELAQPPQFTPRGLLPATGETTPFENYATQIPRRGAQRLLPAGPRGTARETVQPSPPQSRLRPLASPDETAAPNMRESFRIPRNNAGGRTQTDLPRLGGRPAPSRGGVNPEITRERTELANLIRQGRHESTRARRFLEGEADRRRLEGRDAFQSWLEEEMGVSADLWEQLPDRMQIRFRRMFTGRE